MLKVVLMCGGSGGKALQAGFDCLFKYGNYQLDAIINAYDDGKSTGVCRNIFERKILGPSDLRKNQITQYKLKYKKQLEDKNSYESNLLNLFEIRFDGENYLEYYNKAFDLINLNDYLEIENRVLFTEWLDYFFYIDENRTLRKGVKEIEFKDFSLSNIFYASCAALNQNSLEEAGLKMSEILKIENRVHLISNVNLFLSARTSSDYLIKDEGELVAWNNPDDVVKEIYLKNDLDEEYLPEVNENNKTDVKKIVEEADLLIFSTGTQFSSLIPSYMHKGFNEMILSSKAKKYLVMNNKQDLDSKGIDANEMLKRISEFLTLDDIKIVINDNADESMNKIDETYQQIHGVLSEVNNSKHDPKKVVELIMADYYGLDKNQDYQIVSDLDGTLWDDKMADSSIGEENFSLFDGLILSGNNFKHVYEIVKDNYLNKDENIYCNYGNSYFKLNDVSEDNYLSDEYQIEDEVVEEFKKYDEFKDKLTLRGNAILTIRPLQERNEKLVKVKEILNKFAGKYMPVVAGHTTIDVMRSSFSKQVMFNLICEKEKFDLNQIIYLGDEFVGGNDECMLNAKIKNIEVNDIYDSNVFLKTLKNLYE